MENGFLVDIVMPVFNSCDFTKLCLESIFRNVTIPTQIFVINNASTDITSTVIDGLREKSPSHIKIFLVVNVENRGWIGGINQGLALSTAPYTIISNNDVLVYPHAIEEMIAVAHADSRIGLVNPNSNEFGLLFPTPGLPTPAMTENNYLKFRGKWVERCAVIGFFVLMRREVKKKFAGLDPIFGAGYYEDDDYSEKVRSKGYLCIRALGAYVYHFGSKTFRLEHKKDLEIKNEKILKERYGPCRMEAVLVGWRIMHNSLLLDSFCEKLTERLRKQRGYIYIFVPRSKKCLFTLRHDYFRVKVYPIVGIGRIIFFLWCFFRPARKKVIVVSSQAVISQ